VIDADLQQDETQLPCAALLQGGTVECVGSRYIEGGSGRQF